MDENGIEENIEYFEDNMVEKNSCFIQLEFSPCASSNPVITTLSESSDNIKVRKHSY